MKFLTFILFFNVALVTATKVKNIHVTKTVDSTFLTKQKAIFELLYHVQQPNIHEDQVNIAKAYSVVSKKNKYKDPVVVDNFEKEWHDGFLPKLKCFTIINPRQFVETKVLYELMYNANDWETFYQTACWAREHVNEQMFVYTFSLAVLHRKDCEGLLLPPPYEILPNYFFPSEVIDLAYKVKMQSNGEGISSLVVQHEDWVEIKNNATEWNVHPNKENKMAYFTEDIELNTFYYYIFMKYPAWLNAKHGVITKQRSALIYWIHIQLMARYYMERLSNDLGEIPEFSWDYPLETGYHPNLKHINGLEFPDRPNHFSTDTQELWVDRLFILDYERRIREAIDIGYILTPEGRKYINKTEDLDLLIKIIEDCPNNINSQYYSQSSPIARTILGNTQKSYNNHKVLPSVLEIPQTILRDPAFYQLITYYLKIIGRFTNTLTPYTKEDLSCPGVKIESVDVEKLTTYFDNHLVDITNGVFQTLDEAKYKEDKFHIKVNESRLNHIPFTVTTKLSSEKTTKVIFKMYIAPKYDSTGKKMTISENKENFMILDDFLYELNVGENVIERNSKDFRMANPDWTPSGKIYQDVLSAIDGTKNFEIDVEHNYNGYPSRLMLPKGTKNGLPLVLYLHVSPYIPAKNPHGISFDSLDGYNIGYPFNRPIVDESYFQLTNIYWKDVLIFHKTQTEVNKATH